MAPYAPRAQAQRLLSIDQAAELLGVAPVTVRRMVTRGELKARRVGKKLIRIDPRDLDKVGRPVTRISEYLGGGEVA